MDRKAARHDHADADTVWALIEAGADVDQQLAIQGESFLDTFSDRLTSQNHRDPILCCLVARYP